MCVATEHESCAKVFIEINLLCTKVICSQTWPNENYEEKREKSCVEYSMKEVVVITLDSHTQPNSTESSRVEST